MKRARGIRNHVTYGNVVATMALIVALGGTSYAVVNLERNSVGARQIKPNAVKKSEIKRGAVRSDEVRDGSLIENDFAPGELPAGPPGADGLTGPQGPPGPTFARFTSNGDPIASPDFVDLVATLITTPEPGRLLVTYTASAKSATERGLIVNCGAGDADLGLYVDGVPVPGTHARAKDEDSLSHSITGVTASTVAAGDHFLSLSADCFGGDPVSAGTDGNSHLGAILLGG